MLICDLLAPPRIVHKTNQQQPKMLSLNLEIIIIIVTNPRIRIRSTKCCEHSETDGHIVCVAMINRKVCLHWPFMMCVLWMECSLVDFFFFFALQTNN